MSAAPHKALALLALVLPGGFVLLGVVLLASKFISSTWLRKRREAARLDALVRGMR